jgi:predicted secreted protein
MAISGKLASVYVGANKVAEMNGFSLTCGATDIDVTNLDSNGWKEIIQGILEWSVTSDGNFVPSDTGGQAALIAAWISGTTVGMVFNVNSTIKFSGDAYVKPSSITTNVNEKVAISFDFTGTGALTPDLT